ncbi:MAG: hypothetical protein EOO90_02515 [Pedobacter sp.]|nr:MAG: hypothetical protein EOO90_02515 [Pedobacter sp.]
MIFLVKRFKLLSFIAVSILVFAGCSDDDLKNASSISSKKVTFSKDRTLGVEFTYSDSATVKGVGYAPIYDKVTPSQGARYNEMPAGVEIKFYDGYLQVTGTINADYAINNETDEIIIFRKNVVVVNDKMTFKTEELTFDQKKKLYTSPFGTVTTKDGSVLRGTKFSAPQDFSSYDILQGTGEGFLREEIKP